jgi:DNA-binding PucR family transcriptional regulator
MQGGSAVGVAALGEAPAAGVAAALQARPGRRTGVSLAVENLAEVGRARRLAELAARTVADGGGVACLEERLPAALLTARPDLARELCTRVLAPVLALDRASRDLLLDTFTAWLEAGGSAHRAAATLFCHRNTVLNRMRRLERLTRRSLSEPGDLIELTLALEAFKLRMAGS